MLVLSSFLLFGRQLHAAQSGAVFPSHRFPTDESFHLGYNYGFLSSSSNFVGSRTTEPLLGSSRLHVAQHQFSVEFQPTRQLSLGAFLSVDQISIDDKAGNGGADMGPGDQRVFSEFRFFDEPGKSAGVAFMLKFPGYKNPTAEEIQKSGQVREALRGDAQTDVSALLTSELWFTPMIRSRFDVGYTYRTERFSGEIPFFLSFAYVLPEFDIEVRFKGNASQNNDTFNKSKSDISNVQNAFGASQYALSSNPWTLIIEPAIQYWTSPRFALDLTYSKSLMGNESPNYYRFSLGFTYRWAQTKVQRTKTYKEVNIETDQDSGKFQGESQDKNEEPRAIDPRRIEEDPDEEFFLEQN